MSEEECDLMYKSVLRDKNTPRIVAITSKLADMFSVPQDHKFLHGYCIKNVSNLFLSALDTAILYVFY